MSYTASALVSLNQPLVFYICPVSTNTCPRLSVLTEVIVVFYKPACTIVL